MGGDDIALRVENPAHTALLHNEDMHELMKDFGNTLTKSEENDMLKVELIHMQQKLSLFEDDSMDMMEFNKELQWTVLQMQKDNRALK